MNLPVRMRRLRESAAVRKLLQETHVSIGNLVQPYFVVPEKNVKREAGKKGSGLWQVSPDALLEETQGMARAGVGGLMLFGVPPFKHDTPEKLPEQLAPLTSAIS